MQALINDGDSILLETPVYPCVDCVAFPDLSSRTYQRHFGHLDSGDGRPDRYAVPVVSASLTK